MSPLPVDGGHVVIRDPASFLAKKAKIASDGPSKLQARPGTCILYESGKTRLHSSVLKCITFPIRCFDEEDNDHLSMTLTLLRALRSLLDPSPRSLSFGKNHAFDSLSSSSSTGTSRSRTSS